MLVGLDRLAELGMLADLAGLEDLGVPQAGVPQVLMALVACSQGRGCQRAEIRQSDPHQRRPKAQQPHWMKASKPRRHPQEPATQRMPIHA